LTHTMSHPSIFDSPPSSPVQAYYSPTSPTPSVDSEASTVVEEGYVTPPRRSVTVLSSVVGIRRIQVPLISLLTSMLAPTPPSAEPWTDQAAASDADVSGADEPPSPILGARRRLDYADAEDADDDDDVNENQPPPAQVLRRSNRQRFQPNFGPYVNH